MDVDLNVLLDEFYASVDGESASHGQLGTFRCVETVPPPFDGLLDHNHHMTVTVEAFHKEPVTVTVHRHMKHDDFYCREITLATEQSKRIVQYGIVRLTIAALKPPVWQRIESREVPLGRVLIEHNVLRDVQLQQLWEIKAGPCLAEKMKSVIGDTFYGRTALIHCDGLPAIELLEIVANH